MFRQLIRGIAPFLLAQAGMALAQADAPVTPADMRRHIEILASDAFQGRAPATEGETRTINYIADAVPRPRA